MLSEHQFNPPQGDEKARKQMLKVMRKEFPDAALDWMREPEVQVQGPVRVPADMVQWEDYPEWRASRQLKAVVEIATKKIHKGKGKPSVVAKRPGSEDLFIIDGHHHAMARVDHKEDPLVFIVHVPRNHGPWDTLHDKQLRDKHPDDFGKTSRGDLEH